MSGSLLFVGVDVDDRAFHVAYISQDAGTQGEFVCKPNAGALALRLTKLRESGFDLRLCYEATYLGFTLRRELEDRGFDCQIIAPSLVPETPGQLKKTDRLDCRKLAQYFAHGLLTPIHIPTRSEEIVRDLVRSREFVVKQIRASKNHIVSLCRRMGLHYQAACGSKTNTKLWTKEHRGWLERKVSEEENQILKLHLQMLLLQLEQLESLKGRYAVEIERVAKSDLYCKKVQSLIAYRGISTIIAMELITEIGDIKRFDHPRRLTAYSGMDLREYSSGGRELRFSMTKMGNSNLRTAAIEACQLASSAPRVRAPLQRRRDGIDIRYIEIADRCMTRLHKKSQHLLNRGKHRNKVKAACARELLGFVWESLRAAA